MQVRAFLIKPLLLCQTYGEPVCAGQRPGSGEEHAAKLSRSFDAPTQAGETSQCTDGK